MTIEVVVVDDHHLLAQSLSLALRAEGIRCRTADLVSRSRLIEQVREDPPDLVLLDLDLGEVIGSGVDLVVDLVASGTSVLVLSGSHDAEQIAQAMDLGAVGALRKDLAFERLVAAVETAARGGDPMTSEERSSVRSAARRAAGRRAAEMVGFTSLTTREAQVLEALCAGRTVGSIAQVWSVSEATVRSQVRGVLTKLGVTSQLQAVSLAHRAGWTPEKSAHPAGPHA